MKLALASSSVFRQSLLKKLHIPFVSKSPNINEDLLQGESVNHAVERLAVDKANAIAQHFPDHYVIGSDQLACFEGKPLGKPGDLDTAREQLTRVSGKSVMFYTGLCVQNLSLNQQVHLVEPFEVKFRQLSQKQINTYLNIEKPLNCAGSFKSEGLGISLFTGLHGRDPNALIGLPLIGLNELFNQLGIDLLDHAQL